MSEPFEWLLHEEPEVRAALIQKLSPEERNEFTFLWDYHARPEQLPPPVDWRIWMIMAGRGFGKTRAGAEWVRMVARRDPQARIALISSSLTEARAVMVEGESGLLAIFPPEERPRFEPSLHRIRFRNGAQAQLFSAAEPESLRGPQHSHACWAGAKGILRQSGAGNPRCLRAARDCRVAARAAFRTGRGRLFQSGCARQPGVDRMRRPYRDSHRWRVAFGSAPRWHATV